jgi:hypothetical protein
LYWEYSNSGTNNNLKPIKYTGDTFIAVGDEGTIIKSVMEYFGKRQLSLMIRLEELL